MGARNASISSRLGWASPSLAARSRTATARSASRWRRFLMISVSAVVAVAESESSLPRAPRQRAAKLVKVVGLAGIHGAEGLRPPRADRPGGRRLQAARHGSASRRYDPGAGSRLNAFRSPGSAAAASQAASSSVKYGRSCSLSRGRPVEHALAVEGGQAIECLPQVCPRGLDLEQVQSRGNPE